MAIGARALRQEDVPSDIFNSLCTGLLRDGTGVRFKATGGSMWPDVRDGDVIEIEQVDFAGLRVGDIAYTVNRAGKILVHRVVKKTNNGQGRFVVTKGDALEFPDEIISAERVLGRVRKVSRAGQSIDLKNRSMELQGYCIAWLNYLAPGTYRFLRRITAKTAS